MGVGDVLLGDLIRHVTFAKAFEAQRLSPLLESPVVRILHLVRGDRHSQNPFARRCFFYPDVHSSSLIVSSLGPAEVRQFTLTTRRLSKKREIVPVHSGATELVLVQSVEEYFVVVST